MVPRAKDLGERNIIELFFENIEKDPDLVVPFGDDVSAVDLGKGLLAVIKTDMLVASTDVPPKMTPWQAGRKAVVGAISDFAAKGVEPKAVLISLGIPPEYPKSSLEALAKGANAGAREYGAYILGGDTNECKDLVVSVMLLGITKRNKMTLRDTAKPRDIVAVTGPFGKTSAGLYLLLQHDLRVSKDNKKEFLASVYMPKARLKEGLTLNQLRLITSVMDSSDGLAWSLSELSKSSKVGFIIEKLPTAKSVESFATENNIPLENLVFYGGEEYELVLTINPKKWSQAKVEVEKAGGELLRIGQATSQRHIIYKKGSEKITIQPSGWEHFKKELSYKKF